MKLSETTVSILKNFAQINSGVVLQKGSVQKTMSPEQTIMVEANIAETLPETFGIYDLNQFLGNLTTLKSPELTFSNEKVIMDDGELSLNYHACSPSLIVSPPLDKELQLPKVDVAFDLPNSLLSKLLRIASMNSLPNLTVLGKNGELRLQTHEKKDDTSNYATTKIGEYAGKDFSASFKTENLILIPDDYRVEMAVGMMAKFTNKSNNLVYFIALETK
jgi:hypothetical protein